MFKIFIVKIKNMYSNIKNLIQTIRVWQWVKNLIVFTMPIGLGTLDLTILLDVFISFFGISLISSSNYIINDIIDIDIDKSHPIKRNRPIANGSITLRTAKLFFLILLASGLLILNYLNYETLFFGLFYFFGGILYTWKFKFFPYIDVITISFLFLTRVWIGSSAVNIQPSSYLTLFIFFSSLCLAISKRVTIYQDTNILDNSKYKKFLKNNYDLKFLNSLLKLFSILALLTYVLWVFIVKTNFEITVANVFLISSILFLTRVFIGIVLVSNSSGLEDFVISMVKNKKELFYLICAVFSLLIGVYG
jgi:4-hydroxybenzoate polyprenyltransferase